MDVKGFVPMALAASSAAFPEKMLLHLDIHLHRIEIVYLKQGECYHHRRFSNDQWKRSGPSVPRVDGNDCPGICSNTALDPFHLAASEQELYDRLPGVLSHLQHNSSMVFDMLHSAISYRTLPSNAIFSP